MAAMTAPPVAAGAPPAAGGATSGAPQFASLYVGDLDPEVTVEKSVACWQLHSLTKLMSLQKLYPKLVSIMDRPQDVCNFSDTKKLENIPILQENGFWSVLTTFDHFLTKGPTGPI